MFQAIRRYISAESGVFAPIAAVMFMALMGIVAVGVDMGSWMMQRRALQTAVDAAALAGAYELSNQQSNSAVDPAALLAATTAGYNPNTAASNLNIVINNGNPANCTSQTSSGCATVQATITQSANSWFSSLLTTHAFQVSVTATAEVEANTSQYCMLSLDPTVSKAISTSGTVTIDAQGCGLAVNSDSSTSLYLNGNVMLNVGAVQLAGNYDVVGGAAQFQYTSLRTSASQTKDPYADLSVTGEPSTCTVAQQKSGTTKIAGDTTLNPGTFCGGISISGNETVTLNPGTYYMDGGSFTSLGGGSITGTGVTIILTNSAGAAGTYGNLSIGGGKTVSLSASTSGYYEGVAIYQDRNTPQPCTDSMTGTAALQFNGVVYAPSCAMNYGGNGSVTPVANLCSEIISDSIVYHGTPAIGSNCTNMGGIRSIGAPRVKLII